MTKGRYTQAYLVTKAPQRIPSYSGVIFSGVENIHIPSRKEVENKIMSYVNMCLSSDKPTAAVILGEWGEGKTHIYDGILKQIDDDRIKVYYLSASSLKNSYEREIVKQFFETTAKSSLRFLVALIVSILEEGSSLENIIYRYTKAKDLVDAWLEAILKNGNQKKVIIFIDEFEELLLEVAVLKKVLSGIKEVLNGEYKTIWEGGRFPGAIHFIISTTPDSYNWIHSIPEISQIRGGFERRVETIELKPLKKGEGVSFLIELIEKIMYKGTLPDPPPIRSLGVLYTLELVSRGNLGNLVSLASRLFSYASLGVGNGKIKVIDGQLLIKFLENEKISLYGINISCIDANSLEDIKDKLRITDENKVKSKIFDVLVGEVWPVSAEELSSRYGLKTKDVIKHINDLRNELNKINASFTLLKLKKWKKVESRDELKKIFSKLNLLDRSGLEEKIKGTNISFNEFFSLLTFRTSFDSKDQYIFLPMDSRSLRNILGDIDESLSQRIIKEFAKLIQDSRETYFMLSKAVLERIYGEPLPVVLKVLPSSQEVLKNWMSIRRDLLGLFDQRIASVFKNLLKYAGYEIEKEDILYGHIPSYSISLRYRNYNLRLLLSPISGKDLNKVRQLLKGNVNSRFSLGDPYFAVVLLIHENVSRAFLRELEEELKSGLPIPFLLPIFIHPNTARDMLAINILENRYANKEEIEQQLRHLAKNILENELGMAEKFNELVEQGEDNGVLVKRPRLKYSTSYEKLFEYLLFYINFVDEALTAKEAFDRNHSELLKFMPYNIKGEIIVPDITLSVFEKGTEELVDNGFLIRENGKYRVAFTPVENWIQTLLEYIKKRDKKDEVSVNKILDYLFVQNDEHNIVDKLYLRIMKEKGIVDLRGSGENRLVRIIDYEKEYAKMTEKIEKFESELTNSESALSRYGIVCTVKKRDRKTILLEELLTTLRDILFASPKSKMDRDILRQRIRLAKKLFHYHDTYFEPLIRACYSHMENILSEIENEFKRKQLTVNKIKRVLQKEGIVPTYWVPEELTQLTKDLNNITNLHRSPVSELTELTEDGKNECRNLNRSTEGSSPCISSNGGLYNPKALYIRDKIRSFQRRLEELEEVLNDLINVTKIEDIINETIIEVSSKKTREELVLSGYIKSQFLRLLHETREQGLIIPKKIKSSLVTPTSLEELHSKIGGQKALLEMSQSITTLKEKVKELEELENKVVDLMETTEKSLKSAEKVFNREEFKDNVSELKDVMSSVISFLSDLKEEVTEIPIHTYDELKILMDSIEESLSAIEEATTGVDNSLNTLWKNEREKYLRVLELVEKVTKDKFIDMGEYPKIIRECVQYSDLSELSEKGCNIELLEELKNNLLVLLVDEDVLSKDSLELLNFVSSEKINYSDEIQLLFLWRRMKEKGWDWNKFGNALEELIDRGLIRASLKLRV